MSESTSPVPDESGKIVFGIDLGTLRARVVLMVGKEDGLCKPKLIADIPTVVTFTNHNPSKCIVGPVAEGRIIASASNTFCETKFLMGREYEDPVVQKVGKKKVGYKILKSSDGRPAVMSSNANQIFTPTDIAALILLKLKELAEDRVKIPMKNVVITVPAHFTDYQVQATREAAQMAGLNVCKLITEPTAAVLAFDVKQADKTVIVYDFGGTFKVSVVKIRNGESNVISTEHDLFLGGDDFDNVLVNHLINELKRLTGVDTTRDSSRITMKWLKKSAQNAKIDLCYCSEVNMKFYYVFLNKTLELITVKLTRTKFEELVMELINRTAPLCHKVLEDANISKSDIDEVLAIGGVSMIPKVRATVGEIFGKTLADFKNCIRTEAVVIGAALDGFKLAASTSSENSVSLEVSRNLPKPVMETDKFDYSLSDTLDENKTQMIADIVQTGVMAILTDEEADRQIIKDRTSKNLMDDGDVNFILAYQQLLQLRRYNPEAEIPDELNEGMDSIRKGRDDFVMEELRRFYAR